MNRSGIRLGRSILMLVLAGIVSAGTAARYPVEAAPAALDGKAFAGEYGKTGKKAEGKDDLIFNGGRF